MAKYIIRQPFAVHLEWFETSADGKKKTRREQSLFSSDAATPVELTDEQALAHIHKLEPADATAKKLFGDYHDAQDQTKAARQSQDSQTKSLAAQVSEAVVGALIAAGVIKPKTG